METDDRLTMIESELRGFLRPSYPEIIVRAECWAADPARFTLYFIDEKFRGLYRRQRYHYLVNLIPTDYYRANLADSIWFELAPVNGPKNSSLPTKT